MSNGKKKKKKKKEVIYGKDGKPLKFRKLTRKEKKTHKEGKGK